MKIRKIQIHCIFSITYYTLSYLNGHEISASADSNICYFVADAHSEVDGTQSKVGEVTEVED